MECQLNHMEYCLHERHRRPCSVTLFPSGFTWNKFNVTIAKAMNQHTMVKTFTGLYGWIPTYHDGFISM